MPRLNTHFTPEVQELNCSARGTVPLVCATALAGVPQFVRENFGERVLRCANHAARLDIERINDLDCFLPHASLLNFVETVSQQGGAYDLGLTLAPYLNFSDYGIWSDYVMAAPTLGEAIQRSSQTIIYHSNSDEITLTKDETSAVFRHWNDAKYHEGYRHDATGTIGVMISLCRHYLFTDWLPLRIEIDLPRPENAAEYEDFFQCPVVFDGNSLALVFPVSDLASPRRKSEAQKVLSVEDLARVRLAPQSRETLTGAIASSVMTQVVSGRVSIERTAQVLGLSVRTVQRELNATGLSFRQMANQMRKQRAEELLRVKHLKIREIAANLGYSSSAHFSRAFHRETGLTPSKYRNLIARAG